MSYYTYDTHYTSLPPVTSVTHHCLSYYICYTYDTHYMSLTPVTPVTHHCLFYYIYYTYDTHYTSLSPVIPVTHHCLSYYICYTYDTHYMSLTPVTHRCQCHASILPSTGHQNNTAKQLNQKQISILCIIFHHFTVF